MFFGRVFFDPFARRKTPHIAPRGAQYIACRAAAIHAARQFMQAQPAIHLVLAYPIF